MKRPFLWVLTVLMFIGFSVSKSSPKLHTYGANIFVAAALMRHTLGNRKRDDVASVGRDGEACPKRDCLLIGAVLSLLQFPVGRIVIRIYCLWVFVDFAVEVYQTRSASFLQVVEFVWWVYAYNCFSKTSWWYALYHPFGMFGKKSNPAY